MIRQSQLSLYRLLVEAESEAKTITTDTILTTTGWKEQTFDTYWGKGQLSDFLVEVSEGVFEASRVSHLAPEEFAERLSQSKHRRGLGHNFKSRLAKALIRKSKDNMMLALELYNRPSLENRLDGFALLFCTAWEQLLKAELIERDGETSIYRHGLKPGKIRETVSLRQCIDRIFPSNDKCRKNLERIVFYRDAATHLLMPEVQGVVGRLFQAGVLNYVARFEELSEQRFLETNAAGLLTLMGELRDPTVALLNSNYGRDIGSDIFDLIQTTHGEIEEENDWRFAVPIDVKVVFARKGKGNEIELVASADEGLDGLRKAIVVNKPVDRKKTHTYNATLLTSEINQRLRDMYGEEQLAQYLPARDKKTGKPAVNSYCIQAILFKLKWKNSDNEYHYASTNPEYHWYSDEAVNTIIKKTMSQPTYLENLRKSYSLAIKKKREGPKKSRIRS